MKSSPSAPEACNLVYSKKYSHEFNDENDNSRKDFITSGSDRVDKATCL